LFRHRLADVVVAGTSLLDQDLTDPLLGRLLFLKAKRRRQIVLGQREAARRRPGRGAD
jgi:hypothetical protein